MGRKAGHLALGIGKAAGATVTLIPEEYGASVRLKTVVDTLVGSIVKRLSLGREDGVAVLAEGIVELLPEEDIAELASAERDAHGHIRIAEIDFGRIVKQAVQKRMKELGIKAPTIVSKDIGYELRCADPIPFDLEYTRELGYAAATYVIGGGTEALASMQDGKFVPMRFADIMDPKTGRMRVRMVDTTQAVYAIGRSFMVRLTREDFDDADKAAKLAKASGMSAEALRAALLPG
jgi:6-phosphofructokinase 1